MLMSRLSAAGRRALRVVVCRPEVDGELWCATTSTIDMATPFAVASAPLARCGLVDEGAAVALVVGDMRVRLSRQSAEDIASRHLIAWRKPPDALLSETQILDLRRRAAEHIEDASAVG
jgi:hypothetical protein